jgi:hypothetical protein
MSERKKIKRIRITIELTKSRVDIRYNYGMGNLFTDLQHLPKEVQGHVRELEQKLDQKLGSVVKELEETIKEVS